MQHIYKKLLKGNSEQVTMEQSFFIIISCIIGTISVTNTITTTKIQRFSMAEVIFLPYTYGEILGNLIHPKQVDPDQILDEIRMVQSDMARLEKSLEDQYNGLVSTLNSLSLLNDVKNVQDQFNRYSSYINYQYIKFTSCINLKEGDVVENITLRDFAKESTGHGDRHLPNYLREFIELVVPSNSNEHGLLNLYSKYVIKQDQKHEWCNNGQSLNNFIHTSYRYTMQTIMKGYLVILESYAIRRAFKEGNFTVEMKFIKDQYEKAAHTITQNLHSVASQGSTKIRRCDPPVHKRGETYLEMEKLFQGILVSKLTMNSEHTGKYDCEDYQDAGTGYYPYDGIKSDGDWKCHGLMYNCFDTYATSICKPTTPNRRLDGFIAENPRAGFFHFWEKVPDNMGNLTNCEEKKVWKYYDWDNPNCWTLYDLRPCGCICDDIQHPNTLRKFSREIVVADYKNNMVVTGIRLISIDNIIHIDIQQGKLGSFGFVDTSTVHWKPQSQIVNEFNNNRSEPITLSYQKRGITLDVLQAKQDQVLIGAKFELDSDDNIVLSAIAADFSFTSGSMDTERIHWISHNSTRMEIELDEPNIPTLCSKNVPVDGDHRVIKFRTSDWLKDAAQTTVPYLDIQEVVTNPPSILKGVGLRYRNAPGCGGFIGFDLYSHDYLDLISYNVTLS